MTSPDPARVPGARRVDLASYARRAFRDAALARRRSLVRRLGGPLLRKYLRVVPSVFGAAGELAAFRLQVPSREALELLRERVVLALDSAAEVLGGFRLGSGATIFAYAASSEEIEQIEKDRIGERLPAPSLLVCWMPRDW